MNSSSPLKGLVILIKIINKSFLVYNNYRLTKKYLVDIVDILGLNETFFRENGHGHDL